MDYIQYKELQRAEQKVREEYLDFIIRVLKKNGGRVSYKSPDFDNDELSFEDRFPIELQLYGKHGNYDIGITDVYIEDIKKENSNYIIIYADGIDREEGYEMKSFTICSEHYAGIAIFLMAPIRDKLREYAKHLALNELVEKHAELPEVFFDKCGNILKKYHETFYVLVHQNTERMKEVMSLSVTATTARQRDELHSRISEIVDELSTLELIKSQHILEDEMMFLDNGCHYYIEKYQEEYNGIFDNVEAELNEFFEYEPD